MKPTPWRRQKNCSDFSRSRERHECADQRLLRHVIPEDRKRAYDMREAIGLIADTGSVLEMRAGYGVGMITAFIRVEGRPLV